MLLFSVQVTGIFRAVPVRMNPKTRNVRSVYRTFIDVIHFRRQKTCTANSSAEQKTGNDDEESRYEHPFLFAFISMDFYVSSSKFSRDRLAQFRNLSERPDIYDLLSNAIGTFQTRHSSLH